MTTSSLFQALGLNIHVWKPTIAAGSYIPKGTYIYSRIENFITGYSHEIASQGGFVSASITIAGSKEYVEEWIADGLGRHIEIYNSDLAVVWSGFVDAYDAQVGTLATSGGPLMNVVNRTTVMYTPIDYSADPPARGPLTETLTADDADSQTKYGILETVYNGGERADYSAYRVRDALIQDMKDPSRSERVIPGQATSASITLNCKGYFNFLSKYVYNDTTTGSISVRNKILAALGDDPNNVISIDYSKIDENLILVAASETDNKTAWDVINGLVSIGTATDERTFFGVYENERVIYFQTPTDIEYLHRIADRDQRVKTYDGGALVRPWDVRPAQWIFLPDYLTGRVQALTDLRQDPRNILVERVLYTAPYMLEINGQRFGTLPQLLAKTGLGGIA